MAKHEHDFRDGLDVCVGNYGYYNEGELHDTWMRLPMDPDKIEPWLRSHGLFDEEHEEIYISDYDALPFRCPEVFDEYAHLDELNVLAMQLTLLPDGALEHIDAAVEYGESLNHLDELMNLVAQADDLPVYDYEYDEMHVWALMNRGNGELLYCFDFNRYGEIAVNNGYVDLCETCYVDKRADWPALDEYSFEEIRDETVAEWRAHIAEGVVEKPVTPTDLARSASAAAATSAVIAASANQTAPKL